VPLIGSHATVTGGVAAGGLSYAAEVGAEVIQVFVSNPRGWAAGPGDAAEDARLRESEVPVFVHATYMINLGSGNQDVAAKSAAAVAHALRRGGEIGARGVVVHTGSAAGWATEDARERALRQIGEITLPLLDKLGDDGPDLLFEPMAGQGQMLCVRAGDLATYLSAVEHHPKAGAGRRGTPGTSLRLRNSGRPASRVAAQTAGHQVVRRGPLRGSVPQEIGALRWLW
jgi:deoxyribonuclease-4